MRLPCLLVALCAAHAFVARPLPRAPHRLRALDKGSALPTRTTLTDPREWLEDVEGDDALAWVRSRNAHALDALGEPSTKGAYERVLSILESNEKIPFIGRVLNGLHYNFWQDEVHVRGIWRRCTLNEFRKPEPVWEPVLDLDALAAADGVSWVWGGTAVLDEGPDVRKDRVMIRLSPGGSDATVAREFDLDSKQFVAPDQGGFVLPEAKAKVGYKDRDTLLVGGCFGTTEMTDSGYARTVREWKRGTPLSDATLVFEGESSDVSAGGYAYIDRGQRYEMRYRSLTFYTASHELAVGGGAFATVAVPDDATVSTFSDQLIISLRSSWLGHAAGSLLSADCSAFMRAADDMARSELLLVLFAPTETCSLLSSSETKNYLIVSALEDVVGALRFWRYEKSAAGAGRWSLERTFRGEGYASPSAKAVCAEESDAIWLTSSSYTQPTTLALADAAAPSAQQQLKALPAFYDTTGLQTEQLFATSADGTRVPYFIVSREALPLDGSTPALLYGYGGFEISLTPSYAAAAGAAWLEKGYTYVQANIRGGGEYGPRWHQAALKENRNKAYEDFEAVARDLVSRGITSHAKLGCQGGSNGGLLTGNMLVRSPELFGAIVCQVPLLDMRRYHKLLAGASWVGEYGDPDTDDWAYLQNYSPYHTASPGVDYPPILFTTSTRDDRVHPGHARKMVSKLVDMGKTGTYYYENVEGGHGGAADNKQRAFMNVLAYDFLEQALTGGL